MIELPL